MITKASNFKFGESIHHVFMFYINKPFIFLTFSSLIIRTIIAISRTNWIFLWIAIEINILSFIPLITNSKSNQETEASIKYFIAQALGSSLMLITRISTWSTRAIYYTNVILLSAIILKLGIAPFHFWFPSVITSISWIACTILATWQKLAPLIILSFILHNTTTSLIILVAVTNALLGGIIGINQSHLRTIIAYSSITHIGWIIRILYVLKPHLTIIYYIIYSSIIIPLFIIINFNNQKSNSQFNKINILSPIIQLVIPIMLLSLRGMPPLTGFIPKWLTIYTLCQESPLILIFMILGAIINIYFYINILFNSILSINLTNINLLINKAPIKILSIVATLSISLLPLFIIYALTLLY